MPKGQRGRAICTVENCGRFVDAHGLCHTHAERKRRTGDPLGTLRRAPADRFWEKVAREDADACWPMPGYTGYGFFYTAGRQIKAHRFAWELTHGPIPDGLHVLHHCDNPPCCNPRHLFVGTHADNMADMVAKGRVVSARRDRTHCLKGHPYVPENLYLTRDGYRQCRTCHREWHQAHALSVAM